MSSFWSWWIIALTAISLIALAWLLFSNCTEAPSDPEKTRGHAEDSDGIDEYDNPLPFWWVLMFTLTLVFGVGYLAIYPGLGNFPGLLGWTQFDRLQHKVDEAETRHGADRLRYLAMSIEEVAADPKAIKMGRRMFANNCSQCHGVDAKGSYGFPNLTDTDWLWGGTAADIKTTIHAGRIAAMPAWGPALGEDGVRNVTAFVQRLNGMSVNSQHADAGKAQYDLLCASCHGAEGKGNPLFGAPDLSNGIWLYGGSAEQVAHSIRTGRSGVMPAQATMLSEDKIHLIAAYVYSLGKQ